MFTVYELVCRTTGLVYIGFTGRTLEERFAEHLLCVHEADTSNRKLVEVMRRYPSRDQWSMNPLYSTPIYPEARAMEEAFILKVHDLKVSLNTHIPKRKDNYEESIASAIYDGKFAEPCWVFKQSPEYDDLFVYYRRDMGTWFYGHRGRGNTDSDRIWVEFVTHHDCPDKAMHDAHTYFESYNDEPIDEPDFLVGTGEAYTPLGSLVAVRDIIKKTHFVTQDDVDNYFKILHALKESI